MSYSHTQRKKTIKQSKDRYGKDGWYSNYRKYVKELEKKRLGSPISLLEVMAISRSTGSNKDGENNG